MGGACDNVVRFEAASSHGVLLGTGIPPGTNLIVGIDIKEDKSRIWIGTAILSGIVLIALLLWFLPPRDVEAHNILHHLNFAPLLLAGLLFGSRMALWVTLFAFGAEAFNVYRTFQVSAFDAVDLLVELSIFGVAGIVAGFLSDRSRRQHRKLEQTAVEL